MLVILETEKNFIKGSEQLKKRIKIKTEMMKNQKNIRNMLSKFKYGLDNRISIHNLMRNIYSKSLPGHKYVFKGLMLNKMSELPSTNFIPYYEGSELIFEIKWAYEVLIKYNHEINNFIALKDVYEKYLLTGDYQNANVLNEKIKDSVSISLWGIENEFLLKQLIGGFEENRKFLSEITEENENNVIRILSDFYSYKSDTETTYASLEYRLNKFLEYYTNKSFFFNIIKNYLKYKLLFNRESFEPSELALILSLESTMSIIDYYNTFIDVISLAISNNILDKLDVLEVQNLLLSMRERFSDIRIDNILLLTSDSIYPLDRNEEYSNKVSRILDLYTVGNYKACRSLIEEDLFNYSNVYDILEIHSKSSMFRNAGSSELDKDNSNIYMRLHNNMANIYCCDKKMKNIVDLIDYMKLISHLSIRYGVLNFIEKQLVYVDYNNTNKIMDFVYSKILTPRAVFVFEGDKQIQYLEKLKEKNQFKKTITFIDLYIKKDFTCDQLNCVTNYRMQFYYAKLYEDISINTSIELFKDLQHSVSGLRTNEEKHYFERSSKELYYLYMKSNQEFEAMNIIVDSYLKDSSYSVRMDELKLYKTINLLNEFELLKYHLSIKWPIFNYINDNKDYQNLYTSLFTFLEKNDIFEPMTLINPKNSILGYYKVELVFVLDKFFIYDIMKRYVFFDIREKYSFRIAVLDYLKKIDDSNNNKYEKEIKEIIYEQGIKEKMKTVDQKRIYVDVKKIISENDDVFRSKFKRFISLKKIDLPLNCTDIYGLNDLWIEFSNSIKTDPEMQQKYALLKEILMEFSREFLYNPNYGLEKFLSTRIRHGMLDNYLLKPFNNLYLLSTLDNNNNYVINRYWDDKIDKQLDFTQKNAYDSLISSMNNFTIKIIDKIAESKNWIRVNSKEHMEGMFNYQWLLEGGMPLFYSNLEGYIDFEMFYQKIADLFWEHTDELLKGIRKKFDHEIKRYFIDSLEELEKEIKPHKSFISKEIYREIQNNIVACKSKLRSDVDNVVNWFYTRKDNDCNDYTLDELFKIVIETNNKVNQEFENVTINAKSDETLLKGDTFIYLWDLMNILYSNALTHSGFLEYNQVEIDIKSYKMIHGKVREKFSNLNKDAISELRGNEIIEKLESENSEVLYISISNNLSEDINEMELNKVIQTKFNSVKNNDDYKNMVTKEGGTGLVKLYSILKNIGSAHIITFGIHDNLIEFEIYLEISNLKC